MLVTQSCPSLCDPMDCSPPGSSVHEIFQARILEWVAISFSRGSSQPRDGTQVTCTAGRLFIKWATREAYREWYMAVDLQKQDKSVRTVHRWKIRWHICMFSWECRIIFKNEALGTDLVTKKKLTSSQRGQRGKKCILLRRKMQLKLEGIITLHWEFSLF